MRRSVLDPFYTALGALGAVFILATLVVQVVGIAGRELGLSMAGLDAYAGYCLAAGSFLAMAYALRRGDHIRVTLLLSRLKGRTRYWMEVLCLVVATLLSTYFAWFAAKLVWGSYAYHDVSQNVDATPLWIPQLSMALGLFGLAVAFAEQLVLTLGTGELAPGTDEAAHVE
jgi:TRAP-type C4-dicarboxylate transport system permease small subunit